MEKSPSKSRKDFSRSLSLKSIPLRRTHTSPAISISMGKKSIIKKKSSNSVVPAKEDYIETKEDTQVHEKVIAAKTNFQTVKQEIQNIIEKHQDNEDLEFFSVLSSLQGIFKIIELEMVTKIGEDPSQMTQKKLDLLLPNLKLYSKVFLTANQVLLTIINEHQTPVTIETTEIKQEQEQLPTMINSLTSVQKQLLKIASEEELYVTKLDSITLKYFPAIQREQILSKLEENTIFSTSFELYKLHSSFYPQLKRCIENPDIDIADFLLSKIGDFKAYQQYSINIADATNCFERLMKESKPFSSLIRQLEGNDENFLQLLQRPLRRVEEIIFSFEEYLKVVPVASKGRNLLIEAVDKLQDLLESIEQRESVADNLAKVMQIGLTIDGLNENLVRPDRRFIYEGAIKLTPIGQKKAICDYVFLLNDVFIYCNSNGKNYTYAGQIFMHTVKFQDIDNQNFQFQLNVEKEKYLVTCNNEREKQDWLLMVGKVIRDVERTRKVFGVPLKVLMKREVDTDVPSIVEKSLHFIYQYGLNKEGIFRQTGRSTQIAKLKAQLNQGAKVFFSENMDPNTVAELFKQFLRELPEPLMTWQNFPLIMSAIKNSKNEQEKIVGLKNIVENLPKENKFVCQHLMKCLREVCANEMKTKMNAKNLSLVFAPNVIKNSDDQMANSFDQSNFDAVNDAFFLMITKYEDIFGRVEKERVSTLENDIVEKLKKKKEEKKFKRNSRSFSSSGFILHSDQNYREGVLFYLEDRKRWAVRYLILKPTSLQILKDSKSRKAKYSIDLQNAQLSLAPTPVGKPFSFSLENKTTKENFYFAAKTSDEQDEWVNAFRDCCQSNNNIVINDSQ